MSTNTLIVWMWPESIDDREQVWRGSLSHVQSGRLIHFQSLSDLYGQITLIVDESAERRTDTDCAVQR